MYSRRRDVQTRYFRHFAQPRYCVNYACTRDVEMARLRHFALLSTLCASHVIALTTRVLATSICRLATFDTLRSHVIALTTRVLARRDVVDMSTRYFRHFAQPRYCVNYACTRDVEMSRLATFDTLRSHVIALTTRVLATSRCPDSLLSTLCAATLLR